MTDFEIKRNPDGSWALLSIPDNEHIDGVLIQDEGQDPVQVWATARTDKTGLLFYVRLPVRRAMLELEPEVIEQRLQYIAEQWEQQCPR